MNQVAKRENEIITTGGALTPMAMIERAVASGAGIDTIEKLMGLQERWESNQARKAFNEAVSEAKARVRPVVRNKTGHNSKKYADFAAIASAVDPILADLGLSYRFRTEQGERINVTCILSHRDGHQETTTLSGPADTSGNKNAIQAIGSTLTYLQRYSLVQMLGLAASDDDDGRTGGIGTTINDQQVSTIQQLIIESGANVAAFLSYMKAESVSDIPANKYAEAVSMLEQKKRARQA
jgi:hypothetical protein